MAEWVRDFECGCVPEEEHFCKTAESHVWASREAAQELAFDTELLPAYYVADLKRKEHEADQWLYKHYQGPFHWVDLEAISWPDYCDDYGNENPRVMGYR